MVHRRTLMVLILLFTCCFATAEQTHETYRIEQLGLWLMMVGILLATIGSALDRSGRPPAERAMMRETIFFRPFSKLPNIARLGSP